MISLFAGIQVACLGARTKRTSYAIQQAACSGTWTRNMCRTFLRQENKRKPTIRLWTAPWTNPGSATVPQTDCPMHAIGSSHDAKRLGFFNVNWGGLASQIRTRRSYLSGSLVLAASLTSSRIATSPSRWFPEDLRLNLAFHKGSSWQWSTLACALKRDASYGRTI